VGSVRDQAGETGWRPSRLRRQQSSAFAGRWWEKDLPHGPERTPGGRYGRQYKTASAAGTDTVRSCVTKSRAGEPHRAVVAHGGGGR
jgi:hypothetical protein